MRYPNKLEWVEIRDRFRGKRIISAYYDGDNKLFVLLGRRKSSRTYLKLPEPFCGAKLHHVACAETSV